MILEVKKLHYNATLPQYAHDGDAGLDLFACSEAVILPGESALIHTGIAIKLPPATEAQIRPRSGLALRHQLTVLNSPGTIDNGYRGEICIILINHGSERFWVAHGMKIAQMVIAPILRVDTVVVDGFDDTDRGAAGFGSTGI